MIALVPFLLGTILGSFINAFTFRYNSGRSMMGRSSCMSCSKVLGPFELVPVFSYVLQRGRCRGCKSRISVQYPLVEVLGGLIIALAAAAIPDNPAVLSLVVAYFMGLLFLSVYDIRHTILPDAFVYASSVLALAIVVLTEGYGALPERLFAGVLLALPLFLIWLLTKGKAMGLGDAKLMLSGGFLLGLPSGIAALLMAFWAGALYGIFLLLSSQTLGRSVRVTMKSEVPFGPFIALCIGLSYFFHVSLATLLTLFS